MKQTKKIELWGKTMNKKIYQWKYTERNTDNGYIYRYIDERESALAHTVQLNNQNIIHFKSKRFRVLSAVNARMLVTVWTLSNIKCKWNAGTQRFTFIYIYSTFLCRFHSNITSAATTTKKAHAFASERQRFIYSVGDAREFSHSKNTYTL